MYCMYKRWTSRIAILFSCLFFVGCEVVPLDSAGKPIIPMTEEEANALKNMEPNEIVVRVWDGIFDEGKTAAVDWDALDKATNDRSHFVRFSGVVESIEEKSRITDFNVKVGDTLLTVQIGDILRGNSVRDATKLVNFDQFKNQVQFAQFSKALNKKAVEGIAKPDASWVGSDVTVLAAVTIKNNQVQDIIPLEIDKR